MTTITRCFITTLLLFFVVACQPRTTPEPPQSTADDRDRIDLIVTGDYVVTMNDAAEVHQGAAIAVDDGVIIAIGSIAEIESSYSAEETLTGDNRVVLPGLVNGHSHAAMTLLRGVADDLALMDWLTNYIFPAQISLIECISIRTDPYRYFGIYKPCSTMAVSPARAISLFCRLTRE